MIPLNADTLAAAIVASHYRDVIFGDAASDLAEELDDKMSHDDTNDLHAALIDYVSDDLADLAHNANHADFARVFAIDADDDELFNLFTSDDVSTRVARSLLPILLAC